MDFIAAILRVGRYRVRIPAEVRNYHLLQNVQACCAAYTQHDSGSFQRVKTARS